MDGWDVGSGVAGEVGFDAARDVDRLGSGMLTVG